MYHSVLLASQFLPFWEHIYPIYTKGDSFVKLLRKDFRLACYDARRQEEEQEKTEKDEGARTPHSHQNRDFRGKMHNNWKSPIARCGTEVCARRLGPHRLQLQRLVKIIAPGERKHTRINYLERDFQRLLISSWS